jgi:ABC-2 type transport system permease protein
MPFTLNHKSLIRHESRLLYRHTFLGTLICFLITGGALLLNIAFFKFPLQPNIFSYIYGFLLFIIIFFPYFSLTGFSYERRQKTLGRLFVQSFTENELVLAKLLAYMQLLIPLSLLVGIWQILALPWNFFDAGLFITALAALWCVGFFAAAAAVFFGAAVPHPFLAPVAGMVFKLFLLFAGDMAGNITFLSGILHFFDLNEHLYSFSTGILSSADVIFFMGWGLFFIFATEILLKRERRRPFKKGPLLLLAALWLVWQTFPAFFDLTQFRMHTLRPVSKTLLKQLDAPLYITYHVSPRLNRNSEIHKVYRLLLQYEQGRKHVFVEKKVDKDFSEAERTGLRLQNNGTLQPDWAGVTLEYKEKTAVIPVLIDSSEAEYRLTTRLSQLINRPKKVAVITGQHRKNDSTEMLRLALRQQFTLTTNLAEADAYMVIDESTVSQAMANYLFAQNEELGKALFIALNPIKIELFSEKTPALSVDDSILTRELYKRGLAFDPALLLDPDGMPLNLQSGDGNPALQRPYPPFLQGFVANGKNPALMLWHGIIIPYAVALDTDENWQTIVYSGPASYRQRGPVNLDAGRLAVLPPLNDSGRFPVVARRQNGAGSLWVMSSDAAFTDLVITINAGYNIAVAELLTQVLTGHTDFAELKTRFLPLRTSKSIFTPHSDRNSLVKIFWMAAVFSLLSIFLLRMKKSI